AVWDKDAIGEDDFIGQAVMRITDSQDFADDSSMDSTHVAPQVDIIGRIHDSPMLREHQLQLMSRQCRASAHSAQKSEIGVLTCTSRMELEASWPVEVQSMNLDWALGGVSCLVVKVCDIIPARQQRLPAPPATLSSPAMMCKLYWNGIEVLSTVPCTDLQNPAWFSEAVALPLSEQAGSQCKRGVIADMLVAEVWYVCLGNPEERSLIGRCCLAAEFLSTLPQFKGCYPLLDP
ncbi:unnamed protein product, partial [Chrysoparadoxa australica]